MYLQGTVITHVYLYSQWKEKKKKSKNVIIQSHLKVAI